MVALLGLAAVSAALVMVCFEATLVAGLVLIAFAPSAVMGGRTLAGSAVDGPAVHAADIRLRVAATVLFPVAALGLIGFVAGSQADYVRRYGDPLTTSTQDACIAHTTRSVCTAQIQPVVVDRINLEASISLDRGKPIPRLLDIVTLDGRAVERDGPISPTVAFGRHVPGRLVIAAPIQTILLIVLLSRALVTVVRDAGKRACQTLYPAGITRCGHCEALNRSGFAKALRPSAHRHVGANVDRASEAPRPLNKIEEPAAILAGSWRPTPLRTIRVVRATPVRTWPARVQPSELTAA